VVAALSGVAMMWTALASCPAPPQLPAPPADRPIYTMAMAIAANREVVHGTSRVSFQLDHGSDRIVFRLWPNMPIERSVGAKLDVRNVLVDGVAAPTSEPDPTTTTNASRRIRRWSASASA
jgi:hypothetical protein